MYRVGFIDDDDSNYNDYVWTLSVNHNDIELLKPNDNIIDMNALVDWIAVNDIKLIIVDYKLVDKYSFSGTDFIFYLNNKMPDLPCFILTSHPNDSISESLVDKNLIFDRAIFYTNSSENPKINISTLDELIQTIKQNIDVFNCRLSIYEREYAKLLQNKEAGTVSAFDEERFITLYKLLRSYSLIDDLPAELLTSELNKKFDSLLVKFNSVINHIERGKKNE